MAFSHGKDAEFYFTVSGTERDFSAYLTSAGLPRALDQSETSTFGDDWKQYQAGLKDSAIPLEGNFDPTADGYLHTAFDAGTAGTWKFFPAGSAASAVYYQGTATVTSYEINTDIGDAAKISAELQNSGTISRSTV